MSNEDFYEWDESKRQRNLKDHGVDFMETYSFDWDTAMVWADNRYRYDEERFIALGIINWRVYRLSFTHRGDKIRIINIRTAEKPEVKSYVRYIKNYHAD